jgi:hypothetical protein
MIPNNVLSPVAVPTSFLSPRDAAPQALVDYDNGPVAISDTTAGLFAKQWRGRYVNNADIVYDAPGVAPVVVYSTPGVTELSITFDQNGRPSFSFVDATGAHLYWWDTVAGEFSILDLPAGCTTPKVALDDKRQFNLGNSDILLSYINSGNLCMRQQRERFATEHVLKTDVGGHLLRVGFSVGYRFQWEVSN